MTAADLKYVAALAALNHMMKKGWVDICCIREVGELIGRAPRGEAYTILKALHCMQFDAMPKELRDSIPELVRECLDQPTFRFERLPSGPAFVGEDYEEPPPKTNFWKRLTG